MKKIVLGPRLSAVLTSQQARHKTFDGSQRPSRQLCATTAAILDRPDIKTIDEVRSMGARIRLIRDGDVRGDCNIMARCRCRRSVRYRWHPEGVISAVALKSMGGEIHNRRSAIR